jgi:hypothetical protein
MTILDAIGPRGMEELSYNRLYCLAAALDRWLYSQQEVTAKTVLGDGCSDEPWLAYPRRFYIGKDDLKLKFPGRDGDYCDAALLLREILNELERRAVRELTS